MKKIILLITLLLTFCQGYASYGLYNIEKLNNMLSNNAILCMHQDAYGFMWFGTYDGLNLYDGSKVTTFRYEQNNPSSLSGNNIHTILSMSKDYLWIGTQVGLDKFSIKERKVVESYPQYKKIQLIATDTENRNTWIISKNDCIEYYDSIGKQFKEISYEVNKSDIISFFVDMEGQLCIVKKDGELQMLTFPKKGNSESKRPAMRSRKIHDKSINQVFYEDGNIYFIDKDYNLYFYDHFKQHKMLLRNIADLITKYSHLNSLVLFKNDIFLGFMYSGLIKLNMSYYDTPEELNTTIGIFGLQKDRFQEAIWVGTDGRGVELYYSEKDKFSNILLENLPFTARRPIRSFYTDEQNSLWIGTKGDGIIRIKNYDKFSNSKIPSANIQQFKTHTSIYETPVYSFARSNYNNRNDLWMASEEGILYYSYKDDKIFKVEVENENRLERVHELQEVNDSVLWIAMDEIWRVVIDKTKHPYRIKSKKEITIKKDGVVIDDEYYAMTYDGTSKLFIGSRKGYGVLRLDINTFEYDFISMDKAQNKGIGDVISLLLDDDSTLYVGTGSGMTQIKMYKNEENEIKQFGRQNGIINDMIHGILRDENGIIWLSTNKGLVKYNPVNESFFNVISTKVAVSEYSDDAYWFCPITKRLFFGGVNGLVWIESSNENATIAYKPKLFFTELSSFDNLLTLYDFNTDSTNELVLNNNQNTFQIAFTVLDYINNENYDFSYMLDNYDSNWISLQKNRQINFTRLPFGKYTLKVRYKSDVLSDEDTIYELKIRVLPPWYFSTIAILIYFGLIVGFLTWLYFYLKRKLKKRQYYLSKKIKEEQKEKMYESKLRFFTNVTHEFFTPLTVINGAVEQIKKENNNDQIAKYVNILQSNALSLNDLVQEIIDYRKVEELDNIPLNIKKTSINKLLDNLLNSITEVANQNNINLTIQIDENLNWYTDASSFKKIVSNLLSNAIKYTPVGGDVKVSIFKEADNLRITVYNTGRGIDPAKIDKLFSRYQILEDTNINANNQMTARHGLGLNISNSMAKLLQGEITVESEQNKFTQFSVRLPSLIPAKESAEEEVDTETSVSRPDKVVNMQQNDIEKFGSDNELVLIVDDNPDIVVLVSDVLSKNYIVKGVYSANEALEFLKKETPSLIITDIMMPEIDGLSLTKMIREDKYNKQIPIIALTAKVEEKDQIEGYDVGVDAYITKPFSSDVLLSIVNRFLTNKENTKEYYESVESAFEYNQGKLMHQKDREFIEELTKILNDNISDSQLGPDFIADKMKISSRNLYRQLKKILDISPTEYIKDYKLYHASKLLITTNLSIKEIIYKIGVSNKSYFYREFAKKYNMSPKQYKDSHKKENENSGGT